MYYRIDYNKFQFDIDKFPLSDDEPHVDRLIYFFDAVGWLVKMKALTMDEVSLLAYQAQRVLKNPEVSAYLDWLDEEYAKGGDAVQPTERPVSLLMRLLRHHGGI
jgi:hypothetical protein